MEEKNRLNFNNLRFIIIIISPHRQPVFQAYHLPVWLYINKLPEQVVKFQPLEKMKAPF